MTLGLKEESRPMTYIPDSAQQAERPQNLEELRSRLNRRLSDLRDGWSRCDNRRCRREKQCFGEGPDFKCTDDGRLPRAFSPEERAKVVSNLYKEVKRRRAEFAAGVQPPDEETLRRMRDEMRAAARRERESAQAAATTPATDPLHADGAEPPPVAEERPLAPEKQARINRAWNDYVASLPAEGAEDADERKREPGPRITQL
jgi:hypothetical protein